MSKSAKACLKATFLMNQLIISIRHSQTDRFINVQDNFKRIKNDNCRFIFDRQQYLRSITGLVGGFVYCTG